MPFTKQRGHVGMREGRNSATRYGASHNVDTQFSKDIIFPKKSQEILRAK